MLNLSRPLVVFDLETTGVDAERDRIVEIAAVKLMPDGSRAERCKRLNPEMPIPPEASNVHGITDGDVAGCPTFRQVGRAVFEFFDGCDVAGYNILRFDVPLLAAEFARLECKWPGDARVVDLLPIYRKQEELYTLAKALQFYTGENHEAAHSAAGDVEVAVSVLMAQARKYQAGTIEALRDLGREPDWVDDEGRLVRTGDGLVFGFGKCKGKRLADAPSSYLDWITRQSFPQMVVDYVIGELNRRAEEEAESHSRREKCR